MLAASVSPSNTRGTSLQRLCRLGKWIFSKVVKSLSTSRQRLEEVLALKPNK